jgi:CubicO group peptidase (beta-lactamase class C family)
MSTSETATTPDGREPQTNHPGEADAGPTIGVAGEESSTPRSDGQGLGASETPPQPLGPPARLRRVLALVLRVVFAVVATAAAVVGGYVAWYWTYLARLVTYPKEAPVTTVAWYEPKERVAGLGPGVRPLPEADPAGVEIRPEALEAAAEYAGRKNSSALLVVHRGQLVFERYWRGHHRGALTNSMSMAKTVLGLAVGAAIAEGKIGSADDLASRYLTEWADAPDARRKVTLRHLLQMASGLRCDNAHETDSDLIRLYFGTHTERFGLGVPAVGEPGVAFEYNNLNSHMLGIALERATGERYAALLSRTLWKPLGLSDAWLWLDRPGGLAHTYCCVFATPHDWAKVGLLVLHDGAFEGRQVVPRAWVAAMKTSSTLEPDYGLHLWVGSNRGRRREDSTESFAAPDLVYLDGADKQRVYVVPSRDLVVVRLGEQAHDWDDSFLPNAVIRGIR